jgi:hypothetical protein
MQKIPTGCCPYALNLHFDGFRARFRSQLEQQNLLGFRQPEPEQQHLQGHQDLEHLQGHHDLVSMLLSICHFLLQILIFAARRLRADLQMILI